MNDLRSRVVSGLAWKGASQIFLQVSRLGVAVLLARLLAPEQYGLALMALVVATLVLVFSDLALGAALVQRKTLTEEDRSTVFWTALCAGALFTLVGIAASGPIASFYGKPEVKPLVAVLSLSFVITSLGTTQSALLTRELSFRSLELRLMGGTLAGAVVGIGAAAAGAGAWAIILQQLAISCVSTVLLWLVSPWRPRFVFSLASLRELGGFSGAVFGQRLLYYLHANVDKLLVGRVLGSAALGVYGLAYSIVAVPFSRLAVPIAEVLFPAFSRLQDDRRLLADSWLRASRLVAAVSMPALVGLAAVAPDFVEVVLGERWRPIVPVVQILAWVGLLQSLQTLNGPLLQAVDRTGTLLRYSLFFFVAHVTAFVIGIQFGIVGIAAAYAISTTIVEPVFAMLTARAIGVAVTAFAWAFRGVALAAAGCGAAALLTGRLLTEGGIPPGPRLVVEIAAGAAAYLGLVVFAAPEVRTELARLRRRRRYEAGTTSIAASSGSSTAP
ncbi:MAG TPA: MOP flippase family protein [Gaiellaceae bacterium]|nr:MOP flippase family protein [Gaiellaceae bacterium]